MEVIRTAIDGVVIIEPHIFRDSRGYFFESYMQREFDEKVRQVNFIQDNGAVLDVAVDIRRGSPTFGQHVAVELTEDNHRQFFIPRGFAHGFSVLTDEVIFQYKCDNFYAPQSEGALAWDDPDLDINWRIPSDKIILSEKDKHHPRLKDAEWLFDYSENLYQ